MSTEKGERIHSFRVGRTWFNIWKNRHPETGDAYTSTNVTHYYRDKDSGQWNPSYNYSESELADLEQGAREARRRLRIHDAEIERQEPGEDKHQKKVVKKATNRSSAQAKG